MVEADSQDVVEAQGGPATVDSNLPEADGDSDCSDFEVEKDSKSLHQDFVNVLIVFELSCRTAV